MKFTTFARRFLVPSSVLSLFYYLKFKCKISPKAEVEFSPLLKIGKGSVISSFSKIKASDGPLTIGENVSIANGCTIGSDKMGVTIGNDCMFGPYVIVIGNNYNYDRLDIPICKQGTISKGVTIKENVWIGAGSCILDGSIIGKDVIIAPNSVVSTNIPDCSIVQGNPAKVIFTRR